MTAFPSFPEFFHALWGISPHPWQAALADAVGNNRWPEWITVPTGAGKTAALDVAIHALARQAADSATPRRAPARIAFAVNRRIVVDEAFERARHIALKLKEALENPGTVLHPVASSLLRLAGEGALHPLEAFPLRGGTYTDHSWARTPTQPLVLTTTLDQLGSRLLFRGYGVSDRSLPIHAALLGNDSLLILDEAHTSKAFSQTLTAIAGYRSETAGISTPFAAVQLTATPPADAPAPFRLTKADRDPERCPALVKRLRASKPAAIPAPVAKKDLPKKLAETAAALLADGHRRVLVVVNRVATAEAVKAALEKPAKGKQPAPAVELLTGRLRPLDRDSIIGKITRDHQIASSAPAPDVPPLILVATQCVEVGADYDFDALVTELAPLDALRQRFGRLNRSGRMDVSPAAILATTEALNPAKPDPLYGSSLPAVWDWLAKIPAPVDFGIDALDPHLPVGDALKACLSPSAPAPLLLPAHLDLLCQTSPRPHVEPDVACFIHGLEKPRPSVSVLIRDDLWVEKDGALSPADDASDKLAAAPPLGTEMAQVPIAHALRWLAGDTRGDESGDTLQTTGAVESGDPKAFRPGIPVLRLSKNARKPEDELLDLGGKSPRDLRPGDILVIHPSADVSTLIPLSGDKKVEDQYETAHLAARDKLAIRLTPAVLRSFAAKSDEVAGHLAGCLVRETDDDPETIDPAKLREKLPGLIPLLSNADVSPWQWAAGLAGKPWKLSPYGSSGWIARCSERAQATRWPAEPEHLGEQSLAADGPVTLADHSAAVAARADQFSTLLPEPLRAAIRAAALWHDAGKADPRFQAVLHAVPLYAAFGREQLAKGSKALNRSEFLAVRAAAELPPGFRHELLSALAFLETADPSATTERDLTAHLIASHHGFCRPFAPAIRDPHPEPFTTTIAGREISCAGSDAPLAHLSHGVAGRFWTLTRRFGWWGLPYLELMLRLADQFESAKTNPSRP